MQHRMKTFHPRRPHEGSQPYHYSDLDNGSLGEVGQHSELCITRSLNGRARNGLLLSFSRLRLARASPTDGAFVTEGAAARFFDVPSFVRSQILYHLDLIA